MDSFYLICIGSCVFMDMFHLINETSNLVMQQVELRKV